VHPVRTVGYPVHFIVGLQILMATNTKMVDFRDLSNRGLHGACPGPCSPANVQGLASFKLQLSDVIYL
jgi:hypothetical protein